MECLDVFGIWGTLPGTNIEVENGPLEDHEIHHTQVVPST